MAPPIIIPDIVGHRYGRWIVLGGHQREQHGKWSVHTFLCRCDCGTEKRLTYGNLKNKQTRSCGCLRSEQINIRQTKPDKWGCKIAVLGYYKTNARRRQISWSLTDLEAIALFEQPCYYCGISALAETKKHKQSWFHNGIDRQNPNQGYCLENVVACCKICNNAKGSMSREDFKMWVERVHHWLAKTD